MPNFNEPVVGQIWSPLYYWDITYGMSLPIRGLGGAGQVLLSAWDPVALAPGLVNVDSSGNLQTSERTASAATLTAVASLATSQLILAANTARKGVLLYNTDANQVRVKYGATASASSFSVIIAANGYWAMPTPIYTGRIDAIWDADGAGSLIITEM